jgi:hypothetical protein
MLQSLIEYVTASDRVCPQPARWDELWKMLPNRQRVGDRWEPDLPLILGAWWHTSAADKRRRLISHLEYAAVNGILPQVDTFLRSLPESDWAHDADC